jgi:tRNA (cmo5U34)-methyltransferase
VKKDRIFLNSGHGTGTFEFNAEVAEVFDDMLERSVPFYLEQQAMITALCKQLWRPGTVIYDLGCSTATTLIGLARELSSDVPLVGYDSSSPMLDRAKAKIRENNFFSRINLRQGDLNGALVDTPLDRAGIVIMGWTLQFVSPSRRDQVIRWIYESLADEGVLLVAEKVLTDDKSLGELYTNLYHDFKRKRGYLDVEIARKREALENVLVPYRSADNLELFRHNGFQVVETFFQWLNFAGYLCIKRPAIS